MWQQLAIVHLDPKEAIPEGLGFVWRTCLRQVLFLAPGSRYQPTHPFRDLLRGHGAHRFLVEIGAGLHSPLLGETEVFGQLRAFRDAHRWDEAWEPLLDAVEEDVRKIRRRHLTDLGSQSYGSLARRRLTKGSPVVLVGAGRLAQDLLPWLEGHPVTLVVRNPAKREGWWTKASVTSLAEAADYGFAEKPHWLLAAPVENETLEKIWGDRELASVLDFRGEQKFAEKPARAEHYSDLSQLFGELESVRGALAVKRAAILEEVAALSRQREVSVHHRPYGWEDAFA